MKKEILTIKRLPFLLGIIVCLEVGIYLWAVWTSTFDKSNFFAIEPLVIFDKCARNAAKISSALILFTLLMVGYYGLKKIYSDNKLKISFLILLTLFTFNHLIHLLFVILVFKSHGESINLNGPIHIGGNMHGFITFSFIVVMPIVLWAYKKLNKLLYFLIILHLFNISCFMVKTFLGKINPPIHPAYHNQFGIFALTSACLYILYRVYKENCAN